MKPFLTSLSLLFSLLALTPLNAQWEDAPDPPGGYVTVIAGDSTQQWVFVHNVGIMTSTDQGLHWQVTYPTPTNFWVWAMHKMSNGDLVVLQTSAQLQPITVVGRSTDGGYSWVSDTLCANCLFGYPNASIDEQNGHWILQANNLETYRSDDQGQTWNLLVPTYPPNFTGYQWFTCHDNLLSGWLANQVPYSYFYSTDGGDTWRITAPPAGARVIMLDTARIALLNHDSLFYSTDMGLTYQLSFVLPHINNGYNMFMALGNRLVVTPSVYAPFIRYVSEDGGDTWQSMSNFPLFTTGVSLGNDRFLVPLDGVSYVDFNNGLLESRSDNMRNGSVNLLKSFGNTLYSWSNSGLFRSHDGGNHWEELTVGLYNWYDNQGAFLDMDVRGDTIVVIGRTKVFVSVDDGATWMVNFYPEYGGFHDKVVFQGGNIVKFSYYQLYVSSDLGQNWTMIYFPNSPIYNQYGHWEVMQLLHLGSNLVFIGVSNNKSESYLSSDGGLTWTRTSSSIHRVLLNPVDPSNISTVMDGEIYTLGDSLYVSSDLGYHWHGIVPIVDLTGLPVNFVSHNGMLVIGLDGANSYRTYISFDHGQHWSFLAQGPPNNFVSNVNLAFCGDTLYTGTVNEYSIPNGGLFRIAENFTPISGTVYDDYNGNGVRDPGEPPFAGVLAGLRTAGNYSPSAPNGRFSILAPNHPDTLELLPPLHTLGISPPQYLINGPDTARDFGVHVEHVQDLSGDLAFYTPFRWQRACYFSIQCANHDSLAHDATVMFVMDSALQLYGPYSPAPSAVNGDTIWWEFPNLGPAQQMNIFGNVYLPLNPDMVLGDTLYCHATVFPVVGDAYPINNYSLWASPLVGAYDPNDKLCDHNESITPDQLANGDEFLYTVRFQNTGNYPAEFIHILDTIDSNFDLGTFRLVSSSHPVSVSIRNPRVLDFYFENIQLPSDEADEPGSHGFVRYAITPIAGLSINDSLKNTAHIYFDYNPDIVTNTTRTVVAMPVGTWHTNHETSVAMQVYPNPTSGNFTMALDRPLGETAQLSLFNSLGQRCGGHPVSAGSTGLEINGKSLTNGLYWVVLEMKDGERVSVKLVVMK